MRGTYHSTWHLASIMYIDVGQRLRAELGIAAVFSLALRHAFSPNARLRMPAPF